MKKKKLNKLANAALAQQAALAAELSKETASRAALAKIIKHSYEQTLSLINRDAQYDLLELLRGGEIVVHLEGVSHDELKGYIRSVFIESHPPAFIIRPAVMLADDEFEAPSPFELFKLFTK